MPAIDIAIQLVACLSFLLIIPTTIPYIQEIGAIKTGKKIAFSIQTGIVSKLRNC